MDTVKQSLLSEESVEENLSDSQGDDDDDRFLGIKESSITTLKA